MLLLAVHRSNSWDSLGGGTLGCTLGCRLQRVCSILTACVCVCVCVHLRRQLEGLTLGMPLLSAPRTLERRALLQPRACLAHPALQHALPAFLHSMHADWCRCTDTQHLRMAFWVVGTNVHPCGALHARKPPPPQCTHPLFAWPLLMLPRSSVFQKPSRGVPAWR